MTYGQINVDSVVNSDGVTSGGLYGFKNRIINGAMMIDQRGTASSPVTIPNASSAYSVDQWRTFKDPSTGTLTAQQSSTAPTGFTKSFLLTASTGFSTSAGDYVTSVNSIEGNNIADFNFGTASAQSITISFWVRSNLTGTYGFSLGNNANNRSYVATYTINNANTWEQKTVTIAGDQSGTWATDTSAGLRLRFDLGCGSNFNTTADSWVAGIYTRTSGCVNWSATTGNTLYITGVQLEKGSTATSFDYRPYGTELALCQRYFQRTPAFFAITSTSTQTDITGAYSMYVPMRAAPSGTIPSSCNFHRPGIAFYAVNSITGIQSFDGSGYTTLIIATGAGTTTSGQVNGGLFLSAEL